MPTTHTAQSGDSLCNIAHVNGLADCTPLRAEATNAFILNRTTNPAQVRPGDVVTIPDLLEKQEDGSTEKKHVFVKRATMATIRITHGSPHLPYASDPTATLLNISNYVTNKGRNPDGDRAFPAHDFRKFHTNGDKDVDTFKVEVLDIRAAGLLDVELEALCPIYNAAGALTGHKSFPTPRILAAKAEKQASTKRFRTGYLRLVTDEVDKAAADKQTLLVSDFTEGAGKDKKVEILDQLVKASYEIKSCPQNPKCKAVVELPVGTDRKRLRMAVHVLRKSVGGDPIVPLADIEKRVFKWVRRVYAQAGIGPKLMSAVRAVDPPNNLVAISDDHGANAQGDGTLGFTVTAPGKANQVIGPITPTLGDTPEKTAKALAALVSDPYVAQPSKNPARKDTTPTVISFDIVIKEKSGANVVIIDEISNDTGQSLTVGRVNPLLVTRAAGTSDIIGHIHQRTILKNYDTGFDRIDVIVVDSLTPNVRGVAMTSAHREDPLRPAVKEVRWSVFVTKRTSDSSDNHPFSFPHEVGHVTAEVFHAITVAGNGHLPQLMKSGTSATNVVDGTKRIRDGAVDYGNPPMGNFNLVDRLRIEGDPLLEPW